MARRLVRDWSSDFVAQSTSPHQVALVVASAFAVLAITWIVTVDALIYLLTDDARLVARIHLAADWVFVVLTGVALFLFARRAATRLTDLRLAPRGDDVELSVHSDPLPVAERTFSGAEDQDDSTLGRCATTTIVDAHGGMTGEETRGEHDAILWVRLPARAA